MLGWHEMVMVRDSRRKCCSETVTRFPALTGAGKHRRITLTRVVQEPSMLSSSNPKIHQPRFTGVSR